MDKECIFCKIVKKEIPVNIIFENNKIMAFIDIKPQSPIHFIVIPKKHISTINDISMDDSNILGQIMYEIKKIAEKYNISKKGFRVVLNCNKDGGQEVFHIHFHVLAGRSLKWPPG